MITTVLYILLALAFLVIAACLVVWAIQREPAGHGQHATRRSIDRSLDLDWDKDLPCFQPDPALAVATLHNPGLLDDIRAERTRNLPGRGALTSADMTKLAPAGELNVTGQVSVAGPLAGDLHQRDWTVRQLSVVRDGLAPWVVEALSSVNASGEDTAVRRTWPQWLLGIRSCAIGDLDLAVKAATTDLQMWGRKIASEVQPSWPAS